MNPTTILQVSSGIQANFTDAFVIFLQHAHWVAFGVIIGMILGLIPGMGGVVALSILLPFTIGMDKFQAFAVLSGALGATTFAGSITAILLNTPGTSSNAATLIDGYPLTQKGKGAVAIGASAFSSAAGAIVAIALFILAIPLMMEIVLLFGPPQIVWIVISALAIIPLVVGDRRLAGLIVGGLGLMTAFVGQAPQTAQPRFVFGQTALFDGVPILAPLVGMFAIAEIFRLATLDQETVVPEKLKIKGNRFDGLREVFKHKWLWLRCSVIGLIVGAIPGAGGASSAFIAYGHAVQSAKDKSGFGEGRIEGVIACESANDAKDGGQLFPTLGLGIPGSGSMAVFLAALLSQGILPGPRLIINETHLIILIALSLMLANILTSTLGIIFTDQFTKVLEVPVSRLLPAITVLAFASALIVRNNTFDVWLTLVFALLGVILIYLDISRIPFIIAFILGAILEQNYYLAVAYASGDIYQALFTGQLNLILIAIFTFTVISILFPVGEIAGYMMGKIRAISDQEQDAADGDQGSQREFENGEL